MNRRKDSLLVKTHHHKPPDMSADERANQVPQADLAERTVFHNMN